MELQRAPCFAIVLCLLATFEDIDLARLVGGRERLGGVLFRRMLPRGASKRCAEDFDHRPDSNLAAFKRRCTLQDQHHTELFDEPCLTEVSCGSRVPGQELEYSLLSPSGIAPAPTLPADATEATSQLRLGEAPAAAAVAVGGSPADTAACVETSAELSAAAPGPICSAGPRLGTQASPDFAFVVPVKCGNQRTGGFGGEADTNGGIPSAWRTATLVAIKPCVDNNSSNGGSEGLCESSGASESEGSDASNRCEFTLAPLPLAASGPVAVASSGDGDAEDVQFPLLANDLFASLFGDDVEEHTSPAPFPWQSMAGCVPSQVSPASLSQQHVAS